MSDSQTTENLKNSQKTDQSTWVPDLDLDLDSPGAAVEGWDRARLAEAIFEDGAPPLLFL